MATDDITQAKVPQPFFLDRRYKCDVEVASDSVANSQKYLDGSTVMTHEKLDSTAAQGPLGTVGGRGVLAAAGKDADNIFVETAGGGGEESEVGCDEGEEGEEKEGKVHICKGCGYGRVCLELGERLDRNGMQVD